MAFKTKYDLYEYTLMPFRLINALSLFQEMMNKVLQGIEEEVYYLDDILIYTSVTEEEHQASVNKYWKDSQITTQPLTLASWNSILKKLSS